MSNRTVIYLAEKTGKRISEVEKLWRHSKREAKQVGKSKDYLFATSLLKQKLGFITELEESKMKTYKGFQVEVKSSTPDTSLVKVLDPDNSDFGKLAKASDGLIAVPTRDLKETTSVVAVGTGPVSPMGHRKQLIFGKMKSGQKVKIDNGKYGYIQVYGKTHSMVIPLDSRGNPTDKALKLANRQLKAVPEAKELSIAEMSRRAALGEDADTLVSRYLAEAEEVRVKPKAMPKVEAVLKILGIDVTEITGEMVENLNEFLGDDDLEERKRKRKKDDEDCTECSKLDSSDCSECSNNYQSLFEQLEEELGDRADPDTEFEPEEPSSEADSSEDLDDSDKDLVHKTVDPEFEEPIDPSKIIAPDATPDAKEPIDEPPSVPAYELPDDEPPELGGEKEEEEDEEFELVVGGEEDEEEKEEKEEPEKPEKILVPTRKESTEQPPKQVLTEKAPVVPAILIETHVRAKPEDIAKAQKKLEIMNRIM